MKIISHRGNLNGPSPETENKIQSIEACLNLGLDVEVDLWFEFNKFFLGHDNPDTQVNISIFKNDNLWFHLKNISALEVIKEASPKNFFWHQNDQCTITSSGKFWLYPGNYINSKDAIFVMPEQDSGYLDLKRYECYGVCTDYVEKYKIL